MQRVRGSAQLTLLLMRAQGWRSHKDSEEWLKSEQPKPPALQASKRPKPRAMLPKQHSVLQPMAAAGLQHMH